MADERIYVLCEKCGRPVPSGLIIDPATFRETFETFAGNRTRCPSCGNWTIWRGAKLWPESVVIQRFGKLPENH